MVAVLVCPDRDEGGEAEVRRGVRDREDLGGALVVGHRGRIVAAFADDPEAASGDSLCNERFHVARRVNDGVYAELKDWQTLDEYREKTLAEISL